MNIPSAKKGFTVLYAMLVAGMLLGVGVAIFNITYKETMFATVARDSNVALYAADTGEECALFWDYQFSGSTNFGMGSIFATSTDSKNLPPGGVGGPESATCLGYDVVKGGMPDTPLPIFTLFNAQFLACTSPSPARPAGDWWCLKKFSATKAQTVFSVQLPAVGSLHPCAVVEVTKDSGSGPLKTTIKSHGYNDCSSAAANRIERALQADY